MAGFSMCPACRREYEDPADRRFHAQPIACHACGPKLSLARADGRVMTLDSLTALDEADAACTLIKRGHILAVQGLGGYQLACDATQAQVVERLRLLKRRERKPFALMARDVAVIRIHAHVSEEEEALLHGAAAPIVLLERARHAGRRAPAQPRRLPMRWPRDSMRWDSCSRTRLSTICCCAASTGRSSSPAAI